MILLVAILIGLAATYLRARLYHRPFNLVQLRWEWLVFLFVLPQIVVFQIPAIGRWIPEAAIPYIQVISMTGLLIFAFGNIFAPGFWALAVGVSANFLVIILNGGWMPIHVDTIYRLQPAIPIDTWVIGSRLGLSKDRILAAADTRLGWLSDCLTLPSWFPYKFAFSIGDVLISLGAIILLWSLSRRIEYKEAYDTHL